MLNRLTPLKPVFDIPMNTAANAARAHCQKSSAYTLKTRRYGVPLRPQTGGGGQENSPAGAFRLSITESALSLRVPMKIVVAYSGGLDTSVILSWLKETYGAEIIAFCADVGQAGGTRRPGGKGARHRARRSC